MGKNSFILYHDYEEHIKLLSNEQRGVLLTALFAYSRSGKLPAFDRDPALAMAFSFIRATIDRDNEKYQERCRKNAENIKKRWGKNTASCDGIPPHTTVYDDIRMYTNDTDNDNDNDSDNENDIIYCAEQQASAQDVIALPLKDNTEYTVSNADVLQWKALYPAVDILQELRNMRGWCCANPKRQKTRNGVKKFINSWLRKAQCGGGASNNTNMSPLPPQTPELQLAQYAKKAGVSVEEYERILEERRNC